MLQEKLRDALIEHAREGKTIAFSAAAKALGLEATDPADRNTVSTHLNRIARTEHAQGRPLLTALVVKAKNDCPGEGFFATAEELGHCADDHETFFKNELQRVFDHWRHRTLYETNREWSDKFIPLIKQTVGPHLLDIAPFELDTKEATDLIVFRGRDMRIAARVRKPGRTGDALWEFTLRSKVKSAKKTELDKVIEGWGDLMFYAHASEDEQSFDRWFLIDLAAWRAHMIRDAMRPVSLIRQGDVPNKDGTRFQYFDLRSFPADPPILRAGSHPLREKISA